ncbi:MAG: DUF378 domain-containing protein [Candidatus Paceibacterota bacterium]|jgi:uncharacterized membrane protein YuzA (DUF378 family)
MMGSCDGKNHCAMMKLGHWLILIGALNWGVFGLGMLVGKSDTWNILRMLLGNMPVVEGVVYLLVGVSAVMKLIGCHCKTCCSGVK